MTVFEKMEGMGYRIEPLSGNQGFRKECYPADKFILFNFKNKTAKGYLIPRDLITSTYIIGKLYDTFGELQEDLEELKNEGVEII